MKKKKSKIVRIVSKIKKCIKSFIGFDDTRKKYVKKRKSESKRCKSCASFGRCSRYLTAKPWDFACDKYTKYKSKNNSRK